MMKQECFGWGEEGALDEWNTSSQLETKKRPAKGPIAQSWLTPPCASYSGRRAHSSSTAFILLLHLFSQPQLSPFTITSLSQISSLSPVSNSAYNIIFLMSFLPAPGRMCRNIKISVAQKQMDTQRFMQEWCDFLSAQQALEKAGCCKSIRSISDWVGSVITSSKLNRFYRGGP